MSASQERQQHAIELLAMGGVEPVRGALDERQLAPFDRPVGTLAAHLERDDGVSVAVDDERRHVDLIEVFAKVGATEGGDAVEGSLGRGEGCDVARVEPLGLADEIATLAGGEEVLSEPVEERNPVPTHAFLELLDGRVAVSYTHLRAHETDSYL